jgi:hypothetical protein
VVVVVVAAAFLEETEVFSDEKKDICFWLLRE